uniref:Uncharacterized protein LOC111105290 isoform X1 n=1 Tax=Crassostrea virginica TaxID=6565 RepID=A0A8B8AVR4_CRAVI|nr:uncharacterized protein LOC111105290 isoform X1 [Crassostrea virginica]
MCTFQFISLTRHCFETSKLCVLLWVYQNIVTEMQMNLVNICPKTIKEIHKSSRKLNCSKDEYGNNQYLCLPNVEKTSLVEFCHTGTMGLQPDGMCLEVSNGGIHYKNCSNFLTGCPETNFKSTEFYKYSKCLEIDKDNHCYTADPFCIPSNSSFGTNQKTNDTHTILIPAVAGSVVLLMVLIFVIVLVWRQRNGKDLKCFKDKEQKSNVNDQESKYFKDKEQKPSMNDQETSEQPLKNYEQQATVIQHTEHIRHLYSKYSEAEVLLQEEVTHTLVTSCTDSATV